MSKCNKAKNPCKICLGTVTQKNGIQCQGICESWVHYSCLNYTPGKIKDIKAGIIKVTCPCPDCKTTRPKEYRTDQAYSCNNSQCPANQPPKCDNFMCPINRSGMGNQMMQSAPCPLSKCGTDCKQFSSPQLPSTHVPQAGAPCVPPHGMSAMSSSDACLVDKTNKCPSGCSSTNNVGGDFRLQQNMSSNMSSTHMVEQLCNTVGQLTDEINDLMCKMKQAVRER